MSRLPTEVKYGVLLASGSPRTQRAITDFFCGLLSNSKLGISLVATPRSHRQCTDAPSMCIALSGAPRMEFPISALDIGLESPRARSLHLGALFLPIAANGIVLDSMTKIRASAAALPPPEEEQLSTSERAMRRRTSHYLDALNPEQREAVETLDGPLLVLAGAGTGKTRVLTTRIAHILTLGRARPSDILAVTFTNKAAREMKDRVGQMVGHIVEGMPWLGTFHSIGAKLLRRHAELAGLKSDFTILDTDDQIRLLKQLITAEGIDEKRWPARVFAGMLDGWKNRGLTPTQVPAGEAASFAGGRGLKLYADFQARLKILNAADFGDLLLETIRIFRERPEVLREYQRRFKFILVDEYQDTNVAQYLWLRLLAQPGGERSGHILRDAVLRTAPQDDEQTQKQVENAAPHPEEPAGALAQAGVSKGEAEASPRPAPKNICCVGDDDQSIYGWRGAEVDNILRFEHDFPGAKVIRLERNYRSTANILAAASYLIAHNEGRLGKTLRTEDVDGEKVTVTGAWDSEE